jgi:hypothetical protein
VSEGRLIPCPRICLPSWEENSVLLSLQDVNHWMCCTLQIAEPIVCANVTVRQGMDGSAAGQNNEGLPIPQTPKQVQGPCETSTPPPSMDLTQQSAPSSASVVDEVKLC